MLSRAPRKVRLGALTSSFPYVPSTTRHHGSPGQVPEGQEDPLGSEYVRMYYQHANLCQTMW